jgi:hypothetical protein
MTFKLPDPSGPAPPSPKTPPWLLALNCYFDPCPPDKFKRGLGNDDQWFIPFPKAADFLNIKLSTFARQLMRLETIEDRKAYFCNFIDHNEKLLILRPDSADMMEKFAKRRFLSYHVWPKPGRGPNQAKKER